ncbi:MAG: hypothetical protein HZB22_03195 [Deltaproteobacteria bacterium]|nr:hypothetical protein [Deltaproteobacteria bacterium]
MTILIGVLCKDGVVVGADSSATFDAGGLRTIEQPTRKIDIINGKIIVAGTGQVGLGQRFSYQIKKAWSENKLKGNSIEVAKTMSALGISDFIDTKWVEKGQYGALVAFPAEKKSHLCEFQIRDFQPELKTEHLWYVSVGSGQLIADPFLGLMRRIFWPTEPPKTYQDGIFVVVWALQHAIELNPGGVNGPMQIAVLAQDGGDIKARMLEEGEITEHIDNVNGAIEHLRIYGDTLRGKKEIPDIPKPQS